MLHSIEDLIRRLNVMHDKAVIVHRLRNEFSEISEKEYDHATCKVLVEDIQALALGIAMDRDGTEIYTEMEYQKEIHEPI
jgi:hypothetical protein|tara:strand:+ start:272 stop:511 length:240 start_codon:yes stop_codon:yes gene_type:complete